DETAVKLFEDHNRLVMTAFPQLSDDDVRNIIAYVDAEEARIAAGPAPDAAGGAGTAGSGAASGDASNFMLIGLISVIALAIAIIVVLSRVMRTLEKVVEKNQHLITEAAEAQSEEGKSGQALKKFLKNKKLVGLVVLVLVAVL